MYTLLFYTLTTYYYQAVKRLHTQNPAEFLTVAENYISAHLTQSEMTLSKSKWKFNTYSTGKAQMAFFFSGPHLVMDTAKIKQNIEEN